MVVVVMVVVAAAGEVEVSGAPTESAHKANAWSRQL